MFWPRQRPIQIHKPEHLIFVSLVGLSGAYKVVNGAATKLRFVAAQ